VQTTKRPCVSAFLHTNIRSFKAKDITRSVRDTPGPRIDELSNTASYAPLPQLPLHPQAQKRTHNPETRTNKTKRLERLPLAAAAVVPHAPPAERTVGAPIVLLHPVDVDAEGREPGHGQDDVSRKVHHSGGGWDEPEDAEEGGEGADCCGIGKSAERPFVDVEEVRSDSEDDLV
jgi:hypothetical protein